MPVNLNNIDLLKRSGNQMNTEILRAFHEYCSGGQKPLPVNLLSAATFCALVLANMNVDPKRRDLMYYLLQQEATERTHKKLKLFKWTPVQAVLMAYADMKTKDYTPTLPRLIELQNERLERVAPSWGSLMPDKLYALAKFENLSQLDKLILPFDRQTQAAFAMFSGVAIKGQPRAIHHEYLRNFCASWAHNSGTPDTTALNIHSGLHVFGEQMLDIST